MLLVGAFEVVLGVDSVVEEMEPLSVDVSRLVASPDSSEPDWPFVTAEEETVPPPQEVINKINVGNRISFFIFLPLGMRLFYILQKWLRKPICDFI